jgi:hypothetical protein
MASASVIRAAVSSKILNKVDRFFSNRLSAIFVELVQNARRAGATLITVVIETTSKGTRIEFEDNGSGIDDFAKLLSLGDSKWDEATDRAEDPAGFGFFSLIHSGVTVLSNGLRAFISTAAFLGTEDVKVEPTDVGPTQGTRIVFVRTENLATVAQALKEIVRFGSVDVTLDGEMLPREDFLKDSLFTKTVNGVRIGVLTGGGYNTHCNFHGSVTDIRTGGDVFRLENVLLPAAELRYSTPSDIYVKLDVVETSSLHLKLPDRTEVVQDDAFKALIRESRIAMFEYLATLPAHCMSYKQFLEAEELGITLPEASPLLKDFYVRARDSNHDEAFSDLAVIYPRIVNPSEVAFVEGIDEDEDRTGFAFEMGFAYFFKLWLRPVQLEPRFKGFSWYSEIARYRHFDLKIDSKPVDEYEAPALLTVVDLITLRFALDRAGKPTESFVWDLPFVGFANEDDSQDCSLLVTKTSPWVLASDQFADVFGLEAAAAFIGFDPGDDVESDSYETQSEYIGTRVQREIVRVLGGNIGAAQLELKKVMGDYDLRNALNAANISSVRLVKKDQEWTYEITSAA